MHCTDSSFLIDYLNPRTSEHEAAVAYLDEHRQRPFFAPTFVLYELYRYAASRGGREEVQALAADLDWIEPVPMTESAAREAAIIEAELAENGEPINRGDIVIAGIVRDVGGRLVTRDADFEKVPGLLIERY